MEIINCDFKNAEHLYAVGDLLNVYIKDDMGGGEPLSDLQKLRLVDGLNEHPASIVLLAQCEGEFCGLLVAFQNFSTFTVSPMINIHDLIVAPKHRRKGVGRQLLNFVVAIGKQKKCSRITLEVRTDNYSAQHLYKEMGFEEAEPSMLYWRKKLE